MEKKKFKKFKNYLLSSSIPLEVSVSNLLAEHGWTILEETPFYLKNPITGEVEKSKTEIIGRDRVKIWDKRKIPDIYFDVNIECKYRNPSTYWIFFGSSSATWGFAKSRDAYIPSHIPTFYPKKSKKLVENENKLYLCVHDTIEKHLSDFTVASRFVQIQVERNEKFDRNIIYDACEQVMKSSINWTKTNIPELFKKSIHPFISIILPCVVTNSKMLYFENVDIETIQKLELEKLEKACKEVKKVIFLYQIPQNLQFKPKFFDGPIEYLFIPVISNDDIIPDRKTKKNAT